MPSVEQGESNDFQIRPQDRIKSVVIFAGVVAKGVGTGIRHIPELFKESDTQREREARMRREYKFSVLRPYIRELPDEVMSVALDTDIVPGVDKRGKRYSTSEYQEKLASGEVQRVINEGLHPQRTA